MSRALMTNLPRGARFIGPDTKTRYLITRAASEHPHGWVEVRDLSMSDELVAQLLATPGAVEPGCDPRDGSFAYTLPTEVEVLP